MKKKVYLAPVTTEIQVTPQSFIAASVTSIGGDAGIELGDGTAPGTADSRGEDDFFEDFSF